MIASSGERRATRWYPKSASDTPEIFQNWAHRGTLAALRFRSFPRILHLSREARAGTRIAVWRSLAWGTPRPWRCGTLGCGILERVVVKRIYGCSRVRDPPFMAGRYARIPG